MCSRVVLQPIYSATMLSARRIHAKRTVYNELRRGTKLI